MTVDNVFLSKYVLPPIENDEINKLIEAGEYELVLRHNLLQVFKEVGRYKRIEDPDYNDVLAEACSGLLYAIEKYDPSLGASFCTYSGNWIKQRILKCHNDFQNTIRKPSQFMVHMSKYHKLTREYERPLEVAEVTDLLGVNKYTAQLLILGSIKAPVCISEYSDIIANGDNTKDVDAHLLPEAITTALTCLPDRTRYILIKRFGLDGEPSQTLEEISQVIGITRERIRQIECEALRRIRPIFKELRIE